MESSASTLEGLAGRIRQWARELGFSHAGVADLEDMAEPARGLRAWLDAGMHGQMDYMARHASLRAEPAALVPGARRAVMVAIDYAPADPDWVATAWATLADDERAYVSRYALGRDYHKVVRARLQSSPIASRRRSAPTASVRSATRRR
jgi:epoxyqueuosine reductase